MKKIRFIPHGCGFFLFGFVSLFLAFAAIILSANYQYPESPACGGMLGAGFPLLYICDNWGGGSPTSSWGKITPVDVINGGVNFSGFLADFLFYTAVFFLAILIIRTIYYRLIRAQIIMKSS